MFETIKRDGIKGRDDRHQAFWAARRYVQSVMLDAHNPFLESYTHMVTHDLSEHHVNAGAQEQAAGPALLVQRSRAYWRLLTSNLQATDPFPS